MLIESIKGVGVSLYVFLLGRGGGILGVTLSPRVYSHRRNIYIFYDNFFSNINQIKEMKFKVETRKCTLDGCEEEFSSPNWWGKLYCCHGHQRKAQRVRLAASMRAYTYGISIEEAEVLLRIEHCQVCEKEIIGPDKCIDHCHDSGEVRGVLCRKCNSALGFVNDDTVTLLRLIEYLNKFKR